jgi:excinuclease ABC subunit A
MVDSVLSQPEGSRLMLLAPVVRERKGEHLHVFEELRGAGFVRAQVDGTVRELDDLPDLDKKKKHSIDVVVDRFKVRDDLKQRLAESFETALELTDGLALVVDMDGNSADMVFSARFACPECGHSINELEPRLFSFNNPAGACASCDGLGVRQFFDPSRVVLYPEASLAEGAIRGWDRRNVYYFHMLSSLARHYDFDIDTPFEELSAKHRKIILEGSGKEEISFSYVNDRGDVFKRSHAFEGIIPNMERRYRDTESQSVREELAKFMSTAPCSACEGSRLCEDARHVLIDGRNLPAITALPVGQAEDYFDSLKLEGRDAEIAAKILKEIRARYRFLVDVGLNYLSLDRSAETLSGGEAQRIRLASQIGAGLVGVMYILDEPSIGLHQRDNERLLKTLTHLRDLGNTVLVVEHDEDAIRTADHIIDIGPGAGIHGGTVVAQGNAQAIMDEKRSLTGAYLSGERCIEVPEKRTAADPKRQLKLTGASGNNLQNVDLSIPIGLLTCVTGVSGSGKSTLINATLYPIAATALNGATTLSPAAHEEITGLEHIDKCIDIDQSPIGRTPRSNPATYTGIFTPVRELFAGTQEARSRGYKPGRFSFNVKGGRCEACQGDGVTKVEMHFLPDIYVPCDICKGKRYNRETLDIRYKGKNIYEVLDMTIEDALEFFDAVPAIARKLQTLMDVGLSYVRLGQAATTLSGGEAQRVKLSRELSKRDTGRTLYILDEPTTGLHFEDIRQLLVVLHRLRDHGNTVVIIEHNLDVIKTADWVVDLGPEGGSGGGQIIATGTPEAVAKNKQSHTGRFLAPLLEKKPKSSQAA